MRSSVNAHDPQWYVQRLDGLYQRLWLLLVALTGATAALVARMSTAFDASAWLLAWSIGLGALLFIWLGDPLLEAFYRQMVPSSTRQMSAARVELAFRYIQKVGVPHTVRAKSVLSFIMTLLVAGSFFAVRGDGWSIIAWLFAVNFTISAVLHLVPHMLPRTRVIALLIGPVAAIDTLQRNPRSKHIDRRTLSKPWATAIDANTEPIRKTHEIARLYGWLVAGVTPFYVICIIILLGLSLPLIAGKFVLVGTMVMATALGLGALRLFMKLRADQTREFAEQLASLSPSAREHDQLLAGYLVIDVFRENDYRWNIPLQEVISKLDARRLIRDAQK